MLRERTEIHTLHRSFFTLLSFRFSCRRPACILQGWIPGRRVGQPGAAGPGETGHPFVPACAQQECLKWQERWTQASQRQHDTGLMAFLVFFPELCQ